jgi:hypothetical protein
MTTDKTPAMEPLLASSANDAMEEQIRALGIEVFQQNIREQGRRINAFGSPHLGDFSLVEQWVKADGLSMLSGNAQENMRYLFKAWRARNPRRGLHFLRTYLQLLWPNGWGVSQLWQRKDAPYPTALVSKNEMPSGTDMRVDHYLTSRINVDVTTDAESGTGIAGVSRSIRAVVGAKFFVVLRILRVSSSTMTMANIGTSRQHLSSSGTLE